MVIIALQNVSTLNEGNAIECLQGFILLLIPCPGMLHLSGVRGQGSRYYRSQHPIWFILSRIVYCIQNASMCDSLAMGLPWLIDSFGGCKSVFNRSAQNLVLHPTGRYLENSTFLVDLRY